jgi:hypothetical protein
MHTVFAQLLSVDFQFKNKFQVKVMLSCTKSRAYGPQGNKVQCLHGPKTQNFININPIITQISRSSVLTSCQVDRYCMGALVWKLNSSKNF